MNEYELGTTVRLYTTFYDLNGDPIDPTSVTLIITRPDNTEDVVSSLTNPSTGSYVGNYTSAVTGDHTYTFTGVTPSINFTDVKSGFFTVVDLDATDLDYLIPTLRLNLGDWEEPYRYSTKTTRDALVFALKALMARWGNRYTISNGVVSRGKASFLYEESAPPTIQNRDVPAIVLQAAILIASGATQEASWQVASWRDDEIQVSNIQADKSRHSMLDRWSAMLDSFFKLKLHTGMRGELPGFKYPPNWREG